MDVRVFCAKTGLVLSAVFLLAACGAKSTSTVFPESNSTLDSKACVGQTLQNKFIVQWEDGHFSVETAENAEAFKENFIKPQLDQIKTVEFDRVLKTNAIAQDSSSYSHAPDSWGQTLVDAPSVWIQGVQGQGVLVGVVDAYVDVSHPQIQGRIAINTAEIPNNGIDDDGNGVVDDYYGAAFVSDPGTVKTLNPHGTHVTGIIAADSNFGPVHGMAPQAQIIPAQFIANDGGGSLSDAILAL